MSKIGRFEILSEITHSPLGVVYKATDSESGQTVALKSVKLELLGEQASAFVQGVQEEAEGTKQLNSPNISQLYGVGDMDGHFCASMEYVQGNSVATMLARKEGFSIWDLQDIARQTCQGLDHAHVRKVVHYSLEPAKIMVAWDGTVKVLSFGVSTMGVQAAYAAGTPAELLHYMSPEQLRGDPVDARSNLFSLGAVLYEMVTERKAFNGDDADQVRQSIAEMTPVAPDQINRKIHPALSEVIMKALSKTPEDRYQSGQELVNDLERCKESPAKAAAKKTPQPAAVVAPAKPAVAAPAAPVAAAPLPKPAVKPVAPAAKAPAPAPRAQAPAAPPAAAKAAAAGWGGQNATLGGSNGPRTPKLDPSEQFISSMVKASVDAIIQEQEAAVMSAAPVEEAAPAPKINVDPLMMETPKGGPASRSFSEIDELPPMKEIYVAPPSKKPEPEPELQPAMTFRTPPPPEKPKVQPREVAKKAVKEIKKTPPQLFAYSIAGALAVILVIVVAIAWRVRSSSNTDDDGSSAPPPAAAEPAKPGNTPRAAAAPVAPVPAPVVEPEPIDDQPSGVSVRPRYKKPAPKPVAPAIVPGQLTVNSTPAGATITVDGRGDPSWSTPSNLTGLNPGQHTVVVAKAGYSTESRNIEISSGGKSFLVVQLAQLAAVVSVVSDPPGAQVFVDGKDTGRVTPTQVSVEKPGNHTLLLRKSGYLEENTTANLQIGQTFHFAPTLRVMGSTDDIKIGGGKFKKIFGGGGDTAGMGSVSVKTQPKGAQVAVNNRILDKGSPIEFSLNPGNYMIDITMSGYKRVHKVVAVDKGGKVALDEVLEHE